MHSGDVDAALELLRARDIEFVERRLPDYGYRQVFFADPDGNVIEIGEWPPVEEMVAQMR
jgi:catechol 2,3-dioxygenase-like lactoylglutathione lyase family enzyme